MKLYLLAGSLVATLAGTQMLNIKAALQTPTTAVAGITINETLTTASTIPVIVLPPSRHASTTLEQVPQVVQSEFRAITRSRSSK